MQTHSINFIKIIGILLTLLCISCEDVITVPLDTAEPKYVIDASLQWEKNTNANQQSIRITTTAPYYDTQVPVVTNAQVQVLNLTTLVSYPFVYNPTTQQYQCDTFEPSFNTSFQLRVQIGSQIYTATETFYKAPTIYNQEQNNEGGILGTDIEIRYFFDDIIDEDSYYLYQFAYPYSLQPLYDVQEDKFFKNNPMFALITDEKLKANDSITFTLMGISKQYFQYMRKLLAIAGTAGGSPFQTPPATVRGNIINTTQPDNFVLGYFNLSEKQTVQTTVQ